MMGTITGCGTRITGGGTSEFMCIWWYWWLGSSGGGGGGIRCDGKLWNGGRNLNKLIGGRGINWSGGRLKFVGWTCFGLLLFIWLWIFALKSDGKFVFMILSLLEFVPFEPWFVLFVSAKRAEALRFRKFFWWNMLRESNFEDGKTFINGFFERSMLLSHDKLTELDVIVEDDEGCWDCVTIIFGIAGFSQLVGVGVRETTLSGVGDRVRQFLSHKSGVIKVSKKENMGN
jgi:hypothetical protein